MKHITYIILIFLVFTSCGSKKTMSRDIVYDANTEKYQQAMQKSKSTFFAMDSAVVILHDLGWVGQLKDKAKFSENAIPSVYRLVNKDRYTFELPCWDFDTDEYRSASVVTEHKCLDSALVQAKIDGVDDIFRRSQTYISGHSRKDALDYHVDSVAYVEDYADYMRKAQFACLCIMKTPKKYIVNATIRISDFKYTDIKDDECLGGNFDRKLFEEYFRKKLEEYLQQRDTISTTNQIPNNK